MSARFEPGELVNIHITGARVSDRHAQDKHLWLFADDDAFYLPVRMLANPAVNVSHAAPKEWPPQSGDVWGTADGERWFGRTSPDGDDPLLLSDREAGGSCWPNELLDSYGPAKLLWRAGWTPETSPAGRDTEPAPEGPAVATAGQPGDQPVDERAEQIAGLRQLVDWLEANPAAPIEATHRRYTLFPSGESEEDAAGALAELRRLGDALDLEPETYSSRHVYRHGPTFRGGVKVEVIVCDAADLVRAEEADINLPRGGEEVAGPAGEAGPATAPEPDPCPKGDPDCETGDDGSCHDACEPATAPEWTPGAGLERLKRELPGIVPELTDDDMRKADEIIAAARPIVESEG